MFSRSILAMVGTLALWSALACGADVPDTLAIDDLVNHPERWPDAVTLKTRINLRSGQGIPAGRKVRLLGVTARGPQVDAGTGAVIGVPLAACDLLDLANEAWSKLTPAQRALDAASIMDDASLWPDEVKTRRPVRVDGPLGLQKTLPAGTPLWLAVYDKQGVYLYPPGLETHVNMKFEGTDMLAAAREKVLIEKEKRPSRLIDGLRSIMLDSSGKPFTNPALDDTKVFIFYYGANWCQPCHQFSPLLVKWVNDNAAKNPHLTVVMLDADEKDADMLKYMKDEKMPWPAVRTTAWKNSHVFAANQREGYPQLLIMDRWGKIIYNEVGGGPSDIKLHMENLAKLADSGRGALGQEHVRDGILGGSLTGSISMETPPPIPTPPASTIAPTGSDYASQPAAHYALYSPNGVGLATFLGSPIAGTVVMAMNYRRLGRPASARKAIIGGLLATAALIGVGLILPEHSPAFLTALIPFLIMVQVAKSLLGAEFDRHKAGGGKIASMWKAAGVGLASLVILCALIIGVVMAMEPSDGKRLPVAGSEILYSGSATQADAQALGKALTDNGYFGSGRSTTVLLSKDASGVTIKFVGGDDAGKKEGTLEIYTQMTEEIAPTVGGKPITLKLVDPELNELKSRKVE